MPGTLARLPLSKRRKVGTTSSHHGPYGLGYKRATMVRTMGSEAARCRQSHQSGPQFGLQAEIRLHEVGIGSNRRSADCGEYVLAPCTHCPSSQQSQQRPKRVTVTNLLGRPFYGEVGDED